MPEGHTIHRAARLQRGKLVGAAPSVTSPQGRFATGAARLDGIELTSIEAAGKHLFYGWASGEVLHVHLGLFGRFRTHRADAAPPPTDGTRLAMSTDEWVVYLSGPTACDLITPDEAAAIRERLGPDPLDSSKDPVDRIHARLSRRTIPIGQALLDQGIIAGLGNVYRAELLFLAGVDPMTPARRLQKDVVESVWALAVDELRAGERGGRIVTVRPEEVGVDRRREVPRGERTYVYKRRGEPCRRCGTPIRRADLAGRKIWWCPSCQSR